MAVMEQRRTRNSTRPAESTTASRPHCTRVVLRSLPKVVFLYPSLIAAVLAGFGESRWSAHTPLWTTCFLVILFLNLLVISFDFSGTASLAIVVSIACGALILVLVNQEWVFWSAFRDLTADVAPTANDQFFFLFAGGLVFIYAVVLAVDLKFDYWEILHNEMIHHKSMGSERSYPTQNLRLEKDVCDVFEYALLRSGRLILRPSDDQTIVLENVPNINRRESEIKSLLDHQAVEWDADAVRAPRR